MKSFRNRNRKVFEIVPLKVRVGPFQCGAFVDSSVAPFFLSLVYVLLAAESEAAWFINTDLLLSNCRCFLTVNDGEKKTRSSVLIQFRYRRIDSRLNQKMPKLLDLSIK